MSAYGEFDTVMRDERYLLECLKALGFEPEIHKEPVALIDYCNRARPDKAHIVIPRGQLNKGSNDIGFLRGQDGRYSAILSQYDRQIGFNEKWLGKVSQRYKECQTMGVAIQQGYVFQGKEIVQTSEGPQVRLRFRAP
jgi:Protein of unknown function (DUF1257)